MRILIITVTAPFGRAEAFAAAELRAMRAHGHELVVAPMHGTPGAPRPSFDGAFDHVLEPRLMTTSIVVGALLEAVRHPGRVAAVLRMLAHSRSTSVLIRNVVVLPKAIWLARVARQRAIEHVHAYWASTPATAALVIHAWTGVSFSFSAHAWDIGTNNLLAMKASEATGVRAVSHHGMERLQRMGVGGDLIRVVRVGVHVPSGSRASAVQSDVFRVLVPAALHPKKGHDHLIRALRDLRQSDADLRLRVELAGGGPLEDRLRQEVHGAGLNALVSFLGNVPHDELLARYAAGEVDAVLLPSSTSGPDDEGVPVSLIEAMAHGIPVIATASGGTPELVDDQTGILIPMGSSEAIGTALRLLASDAPLRARLGQSAALRVAEDFNVDRTSGELLELMRAGPSSN